jgi:hypothetical protein
MDYQDLAVDRIHYLVDRAVELYQSELDIEADLLMAQAMDIAEDIRNSSQAVIA